MKNRIKVLFVCSGNKKNGISPIVYNQGESLKKSNVNIEYFSIKGKGIKGYIKNVGILKKQITRNKYDIIHAHYVLTGWVTVLTLTKTPIVVSYMGCDAYGDYDENGRLVFASYIHILLAKMLQPFVRVIIVKSKNLEKYIYLKKKVNLIPNGVNLNVFKQVGIEEVRKILGLNFQKKYILFLGNPRDKRKNYKLLERTLEQYTNGFELLNPYPVAHNQISSYLNACNILALTSYNEGSPNVIKEAMACNCPVVATDVGDVRWLFGDEPGYFITVFEPEDVAAKIKMALEFSKKQGRTNGRHRIIELGLDAETVATKVIDVYKKVVLK